MLLYIVCYHGNTDIMRFSWLTALFVLNVARNHVLLLTGEACVTGVSMTSGVDRDDDDDDDESSNADDSDSDSLPDSLPSDDKQLHRRNDAVRIDTADTSTDQSQHSLATKESGQRASAAGFVSTVCDVSKSASLEQAERRSANVYVQQLLKALPGAQPT